MDKKIESDGFARSTRITLTVKDPEIIEELEHWDSEEEKQEFALAALRIGVLTLKRAQGQFDTDFIKRETDRLIENMTLVISKYFDPDDGRFPERVESLVKENGELEKLLKSQIGQSDSELTRTLAAYVGEHSPFMELLSTDESKGFLKFLVDAVQKRLKEQQEALLKEFTLDEKDSALSRLVDHIRNSQDTITGEFSLDMDDSALSRMKKELLGILEEHEKANQEFRKDVGEAIAALVAGREEAQRSTRHGIQFEEQAIEIIESISKKTGDIFTPTGSTVGLINNCKVGDAVVRLGPDARAAGTKIAIEIKDKTGYTLDKALKEIEVARKNRAANVGVFVFSESTAPSGLDKMGRYGNDVVVVWDADDPNTDIVLNAGVSLARGLCTQAETRREESDIDVEPIERSIRDIEKQVLGLDEIQTSIGTIEKSAAKISSRANIIRKNLIKQIDLLDDQVGLLKPMIESDPSDGAE